MTDAMDDMIRSSAGRGPAQPEYPGPPADEREARWRELDETAGATWRQVDFTAHRILRESDPDYAEWESGRAQFDPTYTPGSPGFGSGAAVPIPKPSSDGWLRDALAGAWASRSLR